MVVPRLSKLEKTRHFLKRRLRFLEALAQFFLFKVGLLDNSKYGDRENPYDN